MGYLHASDLCQDEFLEPIETGNLELLLIQDRNSDMSGCSEVLWVKMSVDY